MRQDLLDRNGSGRDGVGKPGIAMRRRVQSTHGTCRDSSGADHCHLAPQRHREVHVQPPLLRQRKRLRADSSRRRQNSRSDPALESDKVFTQIEAATAPVIVEHAFCKDNSVGCVGSVGSAAGGASIDKGVHVVDEGRVGQFDWTLIKADTAKAFTDWLDTNSYPHDAASESHFEYYVSKGWYFVAFKVTTGVGAPKPGSQLCGALGPISLSFATDSPVVPARIAAVSASDTIPLTWRIYTIADRQYATASPFTSKLRFSGLLSADDRTTAPELSALVEQTDRNHQA